jgi:hypothetical protein
MNHTSSAFKGEVFFKSNFSGSEFEPIEISPPFDGVSKAIIKSTYPEGVLLKVEISEADTFDGAITKARKVAEHFAKVMTFKSNVFQQEFQYVSDNLLEVMTLPDGSSQEIRWSVVGLGLGVTSESYMSLNEEQKNDMKESLEQINSDDLTYYDLFYSALSLTDPIAKFMVLYLIVLSTFTDDQGKVDEFILSKQSGESGVPIFPPYRPRRSGIPETIYTKLRNQVGHIRPGTTIQSTREEMEKNLGGLIRITRKIISLQP